MEPPLSTGGPGMTVTQWTDRDKLHCAAWFSGNTGVSVVMLRCFSSDGSLKRQDVIKKGSR